MLNLIGARFEKAKTGQILQELVKAGRASSEEVPTVVTGDFNAVGSSHNRRDRGSSSILGCECQCVGGMETS